ncbi:TetR/AcrR family transcriptional regulator [Corynebacterium uropygiale]|uniref:TetR/AcrR family transcriptional regulator n=1 Tax=Corynebacterium uropygiale TaxID=1775911 RepID=A0A9X1QQA3_9CORY|nr:TetR/AcrR family transcriptional regulator [Corynebacterium uropygiale]MCF4007677.1 TetR/AcrR family transcriptional regulator [Corynebacterium uropygiale]
MAEDTQRRSSNRGRPGYGREDVIRTAVEAFNDVGYEAMSMNALAGRLGLTKSAIYHHISSKEQILKEATDRALDTLDAVVRSCEHSGGTAEDRLRALLRGTTLALCHEAPYVTLLLRLRGNSPVELAALDRRRQFTGYLIELVEEAQEEGAVRPDLDAHSVARLLFGMVNSLTEWYNPDGRLSPGELAQVTEELAFQGVEARGTRPEK